MKKSIFDKIVYGTPEWLIYTLVYGIGGGIIGLLMFGLPGCSVHEPIPGLCYTDKKGTYLCEPAANSQQHEVPTSYEPKSTKTPTTINTQQLKDSLICMEEQEYGIFIDVCKGVVIIPINTLHNE